MPKNEVLQSTTNAIYKLQNAFYDTLKSLMYSAKWDNVK